MDLERFVLEPSLCHILTLRRSSLPARSSTSPSDHSSKTHKDQNDIFWWPMPKPKTECTITPLPNSEPTRNDIESRKRSSSQGSKDLFSFHWRKSSQENKPKVLEENCTSNIVNEEKSKRIGGSLQSEIKELFIDKPLWFRKKGQKDSKDNSPAGDAVLLEEREDTIDGDKELIEDDTLISVIETPLADTHKSSDKPECGSTNDDQKLGSQKYDISSEADHSGDLLWHRSHNSQTEHKDSLWNKRPNVFVSLRNRFASFSGELPEVRSTGNFSSPVVSIGAPPPPAPRSAPTSPLQPPTPSPHHDKSGKQPSWSGDAGSGGAGSGGAAPPAHVSHKARQKKFHRHFPQASLDERVLNYYSCALVGDILLQGHLYITKNYFAFYSNVFGYVTKLLIPLSSVVRVSKEKMARIIPNAVGVTTLEDKHVFGSLLSRDTTYKLMTQVLKASPAPIAELSPLPKELRLGKGESEVSLDEDSSCCSQSGAEERTPAPSPPSPVPSPNHRDGSRLRGNRTSEIDAAVPSLTSVSTVLSRKASIPLLLAQASGRKRRLPVPPAPPPPYAPPAPALLLLAATALLVLLFLSAGLLLYRIGKVGAPIDDNVLMLKRGDDVYSQILKWHSQLHTKSAIQVHDFLHSNLDQIAKVRQSLETLSTLIGGIVTDKMAPVDTRQGAYIGRSEEERSSGANTDS